jgi:outer membrane protein TolC
VIAARLADTRREIARLIGAGPGAAIEPVEVQAGWPALAEPERQRLVLARGDLQRLLGEWHVADKRYRLAIARQIPNLAIGLGGNVDMELPMQLIRVQLPLDAPAEARAAARARDAAYHRLGAGVLDALHEAESARLDLVAAEAQLRGVAERRRAASALLEAERARVETDPDALRAAVLIAGRDVDASRQLRTAAVAAARARVQAARAAGWPTPDVLGGLR